MKNVKSEEAPEYITNLDTIADQTIINDALEILRLRIEKPDTYITNPNDSVDYLKLKLSELEHEVFAVMFLDNRHGVIHYEEMFRGTIDGASVYPREVIKRALELNAAAVIFGHNHPSGVPEQSNADENITQRLVKACALIDIRVLDHIVIGGTAHISFAERGVL